MADLSQTKSAPASHRLGGRTGTLLSDGSNNCALTGTPFGSFVYIVVFWNEDPDPMVAGGRWERTRASVDRKACRLMGSRDRKT